MAVFMIISFVFAFIGINAKKQNEFYDDYTSKSNSTAINGLFTLWVFLSHVCTYIEMNGPLDEAYLSFKSYHSQLVVVPFLFYSGFGIMESIKKKGFSYVKAIPKNRFLKVLLHFDIAVIMFIFVNLIFGKTFPIKRILLSLIGYSAVGNSNWYIFATLGLYLTAFAAFFVFRKISFKANFLGAVLASVLAVAFVYWQIIMKRPSYCYDTIIVFSAGMLFSMLKKYIDKIVMKSDWIFYLSLAGVFLVYNVFYLKRKSGVEYHSIWAILFMVLILLATMKIKIGNNILEFFGSHVFSIYILQRIPMIVFSNLGLTEHKYIFVSCCFVVTIAMAVIFDLLMEKLDSVVFKNKIKKAE